MSIGDVTLYYIIERYINLSVICIAKNICFSFVVALLHIVFGTERRNDSEREAERYQASKYIEESSAHTVSCAHLVEMMTRRVVKST